MTDDLTVRSVTISEVIDSEGGQHITYLTEGNPTPWDVLGMLDYASFALRRDAAFGDSEDED